MWLTTSYYKMADKSLMLKWYFTPIWVINALNFGGHALHGGNLERIIFAGGAVAATGLALLSGKDCAEQIRKLYKYISPGNYKESSS